MNEQQEHSQRTLVRAEEEQRISRAVIVWLNGCPEIPETISRVDFEQLPADQPGMALSVTQGTYLVRRYILGGHVAEYQFAVLYRVKPGNSNDARLLADETLNAIGDWCVENPPALGVGVRVLKTEITARAALLVPYENGDEDHQILMRLIYEVI